MKTNSKNEFFSEDFFSDLFGKLTVSIDEEGMAWFRATELNKMLGLYRTSVRRVDHEDRQHVKSADNKGHAETYVNEPGMYVLIFASRKPEAKAFKRWITHEVLPAIRANGGYVNGQEHLAAEERAALEEQLRDLRAQVEKANSGKRKLSKMLCQEEDRTFDAFEMYRSEKSRRDAAERELRQVRMDFSSVEHTERYLTALRTCREFDSRKEEFRAKDRAAEEKESRIRYAQVRETERNPLVNDGFGLVCRRSELIA